VGILALLLCLGGIALLVVRAIPLAGEDAFLRLALWGAVAALALLAVVLVVLLWGYLTLSYTLEVAGGGALTLRWAWRTVRIPLHEIEYIGPARQIVGPAAARRLWPWPGYYLSDLRDDALGRIQLLATLPPQRQLLVCSARGSFGISPDRPVQLLDRYQQLREEGRQLVELAMRYVSARQGREAILDEVTGLAARYGTRNAALGVDLVDGVAAFLFFRGPTMDTVVGFLENENVPPKRAARVFHELNDLLDHALLAMIAAHEGAALARRGAEAPAPGRAPLPGPGVPQATRPDA
jgi:hypothetical protein